MAGISSRAATNAPVNKFKYNGKEEQKGEFSDGSGLEWTDYGARMYDNQIGRFFVQDRLAERVFSQTPYNYCLNNPANNVDVNGDFSISNHYYYTNTMMQRFGYSNTVSDLVGHYASTYADNPHVLSSATRSALLWSQGQPYRDGIDYSATNNSQDTKSVFYSTWHSMKADGENVTDAFAKHRGQEAAWDKLFIAAEEVKKVGGIDKLTKNSKGIQALGQGLHRLQDAVAHGGVDMEHHSKTDDTFPSSAKESEVGMATKSGIFVVEAVSGNYEHLTSSMQVSFDGMSADQFKKAIKAIGDGMKAKGIDKVELKNIPRTW